MCKRRDLTKCFTILLQIKLFYTSESNDMIKLDIFD